MYYPIAMNNVKRIKVDANSTASSIVDLDIIENTFQNFFGRLDVCYETQLDYQARINEFYTLIRYRGLHNDTLLEYKRLLETDKTTKVSTKKQTTNCCSSISKGDV